MAVDPDISSLSDSSCRMDSSQSRKPWKENRKSIDGKKEENDDDYNLLGIHATAGGTELHFRTRSMTTPQHNFLK